MVLEDQTKKAIIGRNTLVDVVGHALAVPAKTDTGADSSAIWATNVKVDRKGELSFVLFDKTSPYYTGEVIKRQYFTVSVVRSSSGHEQIRYRTQLSLRVRGKRVRAWFNLSDRSKNDFPILLGRRTLSGKFLVDVTYREHSTPRARKTETLRDEFLQNPYAFYKKYHRVPSGN